MVNEGWLQRWYEAMDVEAPAAGLRQLLDAFPHGEPYFPARGIVVGLEMHRDALSKQDASEGPWR